MTAAVMGPELFPEGFNEIPCYGTIGALTPEQIQQLPGMALTAVRGIAMAADKATGEARKEYESTHDALTDLYNRRGLMERGEEALKLNANTAVIFLDADKFKRVNDEIDHAAGDQLLIDIAETIKDTVRETDIVARLGGDEFVIVLDTTPRPGSEGDLSPEERVSIVLERIQMSLDRKLTGTNIEGKGVGISGGFALYDPKVHNNLADLMQEADAKLYANKAARRK